MRRTFRYVLGTVGRWAAVSAALSAILFVAAGTTRLTSLCTYLAAFSVALLVAMLAVDPQLARERAHPGPDSSATNLRFASGFFFLMTLISASFLVGRAHTLIVPTAMRWIALATFISSSSPQTWAMVANPYFSPVVRIQAERGHKLIHFGPYRFVRHPGYLAMCISVSASAVAIGSWLALIPAGGFIAVVYERAKFEEQFLKANLSGYAQYAKTVPSGMFHSRSTCMSAVPKKPAQNTPYYDPHFRAFVSPSSNNGSTASALDSLTRAVSQEPYVDAQYVAEHLSLTRREVLKLTRAGKLPAHAIDPSAARKIYRYKVSEIDDMLSQTLTAEEALGFSVPSRHNDPRQPQDQRGKIDGQREW